MQRRVLTLLLAITLAAPAILPVASAGWKNRGTNEPDTAFDTSVFMFEDPDETEGNRIYFSAWGRVARESHYNPNVALTGSRVQPPAVTTFTAHLGLWKDCNGDGYIGHGEYGLEEYRAEVLTTEALAGTGENHCPAQNPVGTTIYPYNDGTWVREMIWIGPGKTAKGAISGNPTAFYADETAVWGDWGLPGDPPRTVCPGGSIGIRSTGALLNYVDCTQNYAIGDNLNSIQDDTGAPVGGWDKADYRHSPAFLNVENPAYPILYGPADPDGYYRGASGGLMGRDDDARGTERERAFTIWDCSQSRTPTTSPEVNAVPSDVNDPTTYSSFYESLNETYTQARLGKCEQSGDEGLVYPSIEGSTAVTNEHHGRVEVDHPFEFAPGNRNLNQQTQCRRNPDGTMRGTPHPVFGYCPAHDMGLAAERDDGPIGAAWRTNAQINMWGPQLMNRNTLEPAGANYMTFYARIGPAAFAAGFQTPSNGASFIYGDDACNGATSGVINGWNCDEAEWIRRCAEPDINVLPDLCYRVHSYVYHMRDVDCWDGTVLRGSGVRASLTDLSPEGPCADHPNNKADIS